MEGEGEEVRGKEGEGGGSEGVEGEETGARGRRERGKVRGRSSNLCCKCVKMRLRSWSLIPGLDTSTSSNALFSSSMALVSNCVEVPSAAAACAARTDSAFLSWGRRERAAAGGGERVCVTGVRREGTGEMRGGIKGGRRGG